MKRCKRDVVFSFLVRERAEYKCEYCGKDGRVECCHIYGRRDRKLRWNGLNAVSLCSYHHRYFSEHPAEFMSWLESYVGDGVLEILRERHNDNRVKYSKVDREDIHKHLKAEYEVMMEKRKDGVTGRIEFQNYD